MNCKNGIALTTRANQAVSSIRAQWFSSSGPLHKKTPHSVGVMSWSRALERRRFLERQMKERAKNEMEIEKEAILSQQKPVVEFLTVNRLLHKMEEEQMYSLLVKPEVFLSKDGHTIICYHPPPKDHPIQFTKPAVAERPKALSREVYDSFSYDMTNEQISEGEELRSQCPVTWNGMTLAKLFQVKPHVIKNQLPLTKEQEELSSIEADVYKNLSMMNKRKYVDQQKTVRLNYIRETRGNEFANWYKRLDKPQNKQYIPPRVHSSPFTRGSYQ